MTNSSVSEAFALATSIHTSLFNDPENQNRGILAPGEIRADISEPYKTKRLTIFGEIEGRDAYQHLARSQKTGDFILSTVFTEIGGELRLSRITERSPAEMVEIVEATLFMQALQQATRSRT
ncbi:hypothetical protein BH09PAT4_BH09PAT4_05030 [soil metagenome]